MARYLPMESGKHKFYADASVGAVDLLDVVMSDNSDGMDEVNVKVTWSGHKEEKTIPSLIKPDFEASSIYEHIFTLQRKSGISSSSKNVLTSSHCPNCGAPEANNNSTKCEYCGTPLNDGTGDWVLASIIPFSSRANNQNLYKTSTEATNTLHLKMKGFYLLWLQFYFQMALLIQKRLKCWKSFLIQEIFQGRKLNRLLILSEKEILKFLLQAPMKKLMRC